MFVCPLLISAAAAAAAMSDGYCICLFIIPIYHSRVVFNSKVILFKVLINNYESIHFHIVYIYIWICINTILLFSMCCL